jgi:hypothetical protein
MLVAARDAKVKRFVYAAGSLLMAILKITKEEEEINKPCRHMLLLNM